LGALFKFHEFLGSTTYIKTDVHQESFMGVGADPEATY